jgi:predicted GNAT family N-acyltransferase
VYIKEAVHVSKQYCGGTYVDLDEQDRGAVGEALDVVHHPQRLRAVERLAQQIAQPLLEPLVVPVRIGALLPICIL